jgi:hypothetical protein
LATGPGSSVSVLLFDVGHQLQTPFSLAPMVAGIAPTCQGQITVLNALTLTAVSSSAGSASWAFAIPNRRIPYNDTFVTCQCACFDFFAPGGVVVSNAAQVQIGILPQSAILFGAGPPATTTTGSVSVNYCPVAFFQYQ